MGEWDKLHRVVRAPGSPLKGSGALQRVKRDHLKRQARNQQICKEAQSEYVGIVKAYRLNKRFGFIHIEEAKKDVFFCEDDLVISGVNIKQFKNLVYKKQPISLAFKIQTYIDRGSEREKAFDIRIL